MICNALAPICGDRCTLKKGHAGNEHQMYRNGRRISGWCGDYSDDPDALESAARSSVLTRQGNNNNKKKKKNGIAVETPPTFRVGTADGEERGK